MFCDTEKFYYFLFRESVDDDDEPATGIITETVGSYTDEAGNMVISTNWNNKILFKFEIKSQSITYLIR